MLPSLFFFGLQCEVILRLSQSFLLPRTQIHSYGSCDPWQGFSLSSGLLPSHLNGKSWRALDLTDSQRFCPPKWRLLMDFPTGEGLCLFRSLWHVRAREPSAVYLILWRMHSGKIQLCRLIWKLACRINQAVRRQTSPYDFFFNNVYEVVFLNMAKQSDGSYLYYNAIIASKLGA